MHRPASFSDTVNPHFCLILYYISASIQPNNELDSAYKHVRRLLSKRKVYVDLEAIFSLDVICPYDFR